jgi:4-deoxy-L-threo-5-hexosulose-uronate ketol-isomerase
MAFAKVWTPVEMTRGCLYWGRTFLGGWMKLLQMADAVRYQRMTTAELRETFLLEEMFTPGAIDLAYVDLDRTVIGSAVPTDAVLTLDTQPELRSEFFCERRELGVMNVGGVGSVTVDGTKFELEKMDVLYVGRGSKSVSFESADASAPAAFYLLSYLAHADYATTMVKFKELTGLKLGSAETCNARTIYKAIHKEGIKSCQLVMGFTLLEVGSNWNTMPSHTHMRRSEVYFYFDVDAKQRVIHLMGPPNATKHLVMKDKDVVVSPGWSIHSGVGTKNYGFVWGMGGENQDYADMDPVVIEELK